MNKTLFNFLGLSEVRHFGYHKGEVYLKNVKNDNGVIELRSQKMSLYLWLENAAKDTTDPRVECSWKKPT